MNLYLDTSALVKLYVDEPGRDAVVDAVAAATLMATSELTLVEARTALARAGRAGRIAKSQEVRAQFLADWQTMSVVSVSPRLLEQAAELGERHFLRAYDAVHLAAALLLKRRLLTCTFMAFDSALRAAAEAEKLALADI